ncbi:hypothetical protein [Conexibacter sp. CPCC 206217]|uniref:hypothetical protein n=1 Tax=Conexibacter sp. CPCC 206217 TaxID=3064574 RepID=UPI00271DE5AC|nr:hypothetical protein [Conexibacter sp. CPCC 206217]MDO8213495.1 hypothetical protein [Conexibacter sp. CPCC 206217]
MELNDEQVRILRAARDGRIHSTGHWIIDGESRPERRALDALLAEGMLTDAIAGGSWRYELSPSGRAALEAAEAGG